MEMLLCTTWEFKSVSGATWRWLASLELKGSYCHRNKKKGKLNKLGAQRPSHWLQVLAHMNRDHYHSLSFSLALSLSLSMGPNPAPPLFSLFHHWKVDPTWKTFLLPPPLHSSSFDRKKPGNGTAFQGVSRKIILAPSRVRQGEHGGPIYFRNGGMNKEKRERECTSVKRPIE